MVKMMTSTASASIRWHAVHESHMKTRDLEILSVDRVKHLDLTINFGAAEHVIGTKILPHVPVQTSEGGKRAYSSRRPMGQKW